MLSGDLPRLATLGNKVVNAATFEPVLLRGVNRSGLEYAFRTGPCCLEQAGMSAQEFDAIASWGANIVRLPFNQAWVLGSSVLDPETYLGVIDQAVRLAAERGMFTLLDLQWLDADTPRGFLRDGTPNFVPALPDAGSLTAWERLAARYRNEPAVLYDIFNEPHDPLPDDVTLPLLARRRVLAREWHPWARALVENIRRQNPAALIFVSGLDWGYDLSEFPLKHVEDVVYSTHAYPSKTKPWKKAFGHLSSTHPVFVAEWGGEEHDLLWGERLLRYLDELQLGWTAWSWSDHPHLVRTGSNFEPTSFGSLVQQALPSAAATALKSSSREERLPPTRPQSDPDAV